VADNVNKNLVLRSKRNGGDPMSGPGGNKVLWDEAEDEVTGKTSDGDVNYKDGKAYAGGEDQRAVADKARAEAKKKNKLKKLYPSNSDSDDN
jgi:hypothetical protein